MYNLYSSEKKKDFAKEPKIFIFSDFFPKWGPFNVRFQKKFFSEFLKIWISFQKLAFPGPGKQKKKQSHEFWWL